jgi:low affinity Fe/Cu permease
MSETIPQRAPPSLTGRGENKRSRERAPAGSPIHGARPHARHSGVLHAFDHFAAAVTRWAGSPLAFGLALITVLVWCATGPFFDYSETWQLIINTGTTIVTFLMVFLIQQSQNKDSVAVHLKLDELLAANRDANNRMIGIEDLDEADLRDVASFYLRLAEQAKENAAPGEPSDLGPGRP